MIYPYRVLPLALSLGAVVLLSGCIVGNDFKHTRQTTVGQELIDLDAAKAKGLLNAEEYAAARANLLKWSEYGFELEAAPSR